MPLKLVTIALFSFSNIDSYGLNYDYWVLGEFIYTVVVIVVNLKIVIDTHNHSIYSLTLSFLSIFCYYLSVFILSYIEKFNSFRKSIFYICGHWNNVLFDFKFIISSFIAVFFCISFEIFISKFLILFGFSIPGDKLPPYFDYNVFNNKSIISNENDNEIRKPLL